MQVQQLVVVAAAGAAGMQPELQPGLLPGLQQQVGQLLVRCKAARTWLFSSSSSSSRVNSKHRRAAQQQLAAARVTPTELAGSSRHQLVLLLVLQAQVLLQGQP
jgi:hypothetical protein